MKTAMILLLACALGLAVGAGAHDIGNLTVSDDAATFSHVSELVCNLFSEMDFEPVDWEGAVTDAYEQTADFGLNEIIDELSLKDLAEGAVWGDNTPPEAWQEYQTFFDDDTWLNTDVLQGIDDPFEGESDGARAENVQKTARDANGVAHVLSLLELAEDSLKTYRFSDDVVDAETALFYVESAWVIYHGYDNGDGDDGTGCAPYGTGRSRSAQFGMADDVNVRITTAFEEAQTAVDAAIDDDSKVDAAEDAVVAAFAEVKKSTLITYLRAAVRYANRMDQNAAAGDAANLRVNQLEGLSFYRTIEPYASSIDEEASSIIDKVFEFDNYAPSADGSIDISDYEDVAPTVEAAVDAILDKAGIDIETEFGEYEG